MFDLFFKVDKKMGCNNDPSVSTDSCQNGQSKNTTSHHIVYTILNMYKFGAAWGATIVTYLIITKSDIAGQSFIAYLSFLAALGAVIPFYLKKAETENIRKDTMAKNRSRLNLGKDVHQLIKQDELDSESISLTKVLTSDTDMQIMYPNGGYGPVISDQQTYSSPMTNEGGQNI